MLVVTHSPKLLLSSLIRGGDWLYFVTQIWVAHPLSVPDSCWWGNFCCLFCAGGTCTSALMLQIFCWRVHRLTHFTPHSASPEKATDVYRITILLVLLNRTGYGSLANVAELYVSHPPILPNVTEVPLYCGTIFRKSPGSAAVTTLGQILQCSIWARH